MSALACPTCGDHLTPITGTAPHAPWTCPRCRIGFWDAELTPAARALWDPAMQCFRSDRDPEGVDAIIDAVADEVAAARERGSGLHPRHRPHLTEEQTAFYERLIGGGA